MNILHLIESIEGLKTLVEMLEGPEGQVMQDSFFQDQNSSQLIFGILEYAKPGHNAEEVAQALWLLVRLCRRSLNKNTACLANLEFIGQELHLTTIFHRLNEHQECLTDNNVGLACSWLIMVLASDSAERQQRLADINICALQVLASLMQNFKSNVAYPKVSEFLTRACRNLASNDEVAHKLVQVGTCEFLTDVITSYVDQLDTLLKNNEKLGFLRKELNGDIEKSAEMVSLEVLEAAMWASVNLTCDVDIAQIFASVQGLHAVLRCIEVISGLFRQNELRMHLQLDTASPSESAVGAALLVLRNLTARGAYAYSLILHTPVIRTLFDCMRAYPSSFEVNDPAFFIIVNLAEEKNMAVKLMEEDVASVLVLAAGALSVNYRKIDDEQVETRDERHFKTGPIAEAVTWATRHLASYSQSNALRLGQVGIIEILVSFLVEYLHRDGMVQSICECLAALTFSLRATEQETSKPIIQNIVRLVNSGGLKTIVAALKQHSGPIASQLSEMHEPAMILLAKTVEEMSRYLSNSHSDQKSDNASIEHPTVLELSHAKAMLDSLKSRDCPHNIFVPIIETMREHPASGDIARCGCQLLLDLYYVSPAERLILEDKKLFDPSIGKAALGGNTLQEVCQTWGVNEIFEKFSPAAKTSETLDDNKEC